MELPLDHFRLIGVSPSATSEEILRAFQLRLDKTPKQGFTYEVLTQRSELLRLTADLLTDIDRRRGYENLLLKGASGLEFASNREVAGLILLWESGSPQEAFKFTRKALQPPQTPALGSSRESDLTLLAALTARDSAIKEQKLRSYSNAAEFLQEGIQILQRMGKRGELRKELEEDLLSLLPYRILDLLSRDINDQESHNKGLSMLETLIMKRGGLEGKNKSEYITYLNQQEFEAFFSQIKSFLTVQEQIDLFLDLYKRGSLEAGFLAFLALTANGFYRKKPDKIYEARKIIKKINLPGLDSMPLIGCLDLLLADIDQASDKFLRSSDEKLRDWLNNYPGNQLEALCIFCKNWLESDVLAGYRDINLEEIDLDSWFEDKEIQEFIEKFEKKSNKLTQSKFQIQQKFKKDSLNQTLKDTDTLSDNSDEMKLPWPGGIRENDENINSREDLETEEEKLNEEFTKNRFVEFYKYSKEKIAELKFGFGELLEKKLHFSKTPYVTYLYVFLILFSFGMGVGFLSNNYKRLFQSEKVSDKFLIDSNQKVKNVEKNILKENKKQFLNTEELIISNQLDVIPIEIKVITNQSPSLEELQYLINTWLTTKGTYLAGKSELNLSKIVKDSLIKRTIKQRESDIKEGIYKEINAKIEKINLSSQTSSRIVVLVELNYLERIKRNSGELINETSLSSLKVKYILGYINNSWKLVDFVSGI